MSHVSFSELKIWNECPFKHKLVYLDKLKGFAGNVHTAFGTAVHSAIEKKIFDKNLNEPEFFETEFLEELKSLPDEIKNNLDKEFVSTLRKQGKFLIPLVIPALKEYFEDFEIISTEERLYEPVKDFVENEYDFKGYIDLVVKTKDGKYHIIDWKTCSWGWDSRRKTDKMTTYQLTFYKYYFALKHNIDSKDIETYFGLVKRTAKHNHIELFKVTSGAKKTKNAIKFLTKALYNMNKEIYVKNRLSCHGRFGTCEFYKTEHCK